MDLRSWGTNAKSRASSRKRCYLSLRLETLESRRLLSVSNGDSEPLLATDNDAATADPAIISSETDTGAPLAPLAQSATTHIVLAGDSLQAAIDIAQAGDTIELEAGATFVGNFVLPNKAGTDWITIRGSSHDSLPEERITAADAELLPKIVTPNLSPAVRAEFGAHHYRLEGIEITSQADHTLDLVLLGYDGRYPEAISEFVSDITIDRSYIHGSSTGQITHAINASGDNITISNSEISDIKRAGAYAQAFVATMGLSGYSIENNFIESSGGNIVFGGSENDLPGEFNPQDILISNNLISKSNAWNVGHDDYAGTEWTIGNLLEFKAGKHIVVEGNVLENVWADGLGTHGGTAIRVIAQDADIDDLIIENNVIRHARSLLEMSSDSHELSNFVFENNLAYEIQSTLFSLSAPAGKQTQNVTIRNNTAMFGADAELGGLGRHNLLFNGAAASVANLVYQDNVLGGGLNGIEGPGFEAGLDSVLHYAAGFDVRGNHIFVPNQVGLETYAIGNSYEQDGNFYGDFILWGDIASMGFSNLALSSPEHFNLQSNLAFNGKGADIGTILTAIHAPSSLDGSLHIVLAGDSLQAAIDAALPGDTIVLEAGATFTGNFVLPNKLGTDWITIRGWAHHLLPEGRVSAADATWMPKIVTPNVGPAIRADFGAHNYRIEGIEITSATTHVTNLVILGFEGRYPSAASEFARNITIDRSYIHGTSTRQITHAINASGGNITLSNSEVSNIKNRSFDSQAFLAVTGLSGYLIENNFLEAAGENIMFGGLSRDIDDAFNPRNIVIRGNSISKPNSWKEGHPDYAGYDWSIKNLVEFKVGKHIVVEGNIIENNWADSQNGTAILLTPSEADIDDVVIRNNIIRQVTGLIVITPEDHQLSNVVFENNLAYDIERDSFGLIAPTGKRTQNVTIRNNTVLFGPNALLDGRGIKNLGFGDTDTAVANLIYQDNVLGAGFYNIHGSGHGTGLPSVLHYADGFDIRGNQMIAPDWWGADSYALGNPYDQDGDFYGDFTLWGSLADMGFANLALTSPEHFDLSGNPAFAGKGADIDAILAMVNLPPAVTAVTANGLSERTVSKLTSSVDGLTTIEVQFNRPVFFTADDVSVNAVSFSGNTELLGEGVTAQTISGSGTDTMTITFAAGSVVDTWMKVVLHDGIVDAEGNALDGEASAVGPRRGYIFDNVADLPSGNHIAGGDAVFYTGNLVGDNNGDGAVDVLDILIAFSNISSETPTSSFGLTELDGDTDGDGDVDTSDLLKVFTNNGTNLDALPTMLTPSLALAALTSIDEDIHQWSFASAPLATNPLATIAEQEREDNHDAVFADSYNVTTSTSLPDDELEGSADEDSEEESDDSGDINSDGIDSGAIDSGNVDLLFSESDDDEELASTIFTL